MALDLANDHRARDPLALDGHVDDFVLARGLDRLDQLDRRKLHRHGIDVVTEHVAGHHAVAPETDYFLAQDLSRLNRQLFSSHLYPPSGVAGIILLGEPGLNDKA